MKAVSPYPEYKESKIPWVNAVPMEWNVSPLFSVAHESRSKNTEERENNLLSLSYGRIVRKDIQAVDGLLPASFSTYQIVQKNDIVLRLTDLQNDKRSLRSAIAPERGIITSAYLALTPTRVIPAFLAYLLRSYDLQKVFYSMGGGLRQSMQFWDLKQLPIILPPVTTQESIVHYLDRETAKMDSLITKQERLIELLVEKRQAIITQAVTKGLDPSAPTKASGIPWLGDVPEHWNITKFRHFSRILGGFAPDQAKPQPVGAYPYLKVGSLNILDAKQQVVSAEDFIVDRKFTCPPGTLLFPKRGAAIFTNKVALTRVRSAFDTNLMGMTLDDSKAVNPFILYWLRARTLNELADTSTLPQINNKHIYPLVIALPPVSEQELILRELQVRLNKLDLLVSQSMKAIVLLKERRSALISAAVTGKIDVREGAA